jgi:hypothetical protein
VARCAVCSEHASLTACFICAFQTKSVDRRKEPELRAAAEEAYDNLVAFIKYRRSVQ